MPGLNLNLKFQWSGGKPPYPPENAQEMFDEECLRVITPYVPVDTHTLEHSALVASNVGGGELEWATLYAAAQYYNTADSRPYDSLRGGHWGDRAKADNLAHLEQFAKGMYNR